MDFWDLTVLIFRRWKFALPLLLLTIGGTAYVAMTAKPDYTMTSYVQFIPAKIASNDNNPAAASMRNPWNQLGLNTLGQASIYATQDQGFLDSLKAGRHTTNFTLTMTYPNPIVTVEVVGRTQEDARDTTALVISRLRDTAAALQKQSGVQDVDLIATQRLDQGQNLTPSTSKVKRAILAVGAAGLILTAGGAVGLDAILRRRARKRREKEEAGSPSPEAAPINGKAVPASPSVPLEVAAASGPAYNPPELPPGEMPADRPVSLAGKAPSPSMERTAIVVKRAGSVVKHPPVAKSTRSPQAATYRSVNAQTEPNGEGQDAVPAAPNGKSGATESDVRVVLQPKWVAGENGGKSH